MLEYKNQDYETAVKTKRNGNRFLNGFAMYISVTTVVLIVKAFSKLDISIVMACLGAGKFGVDVFMLALFNHLDWQVTQQAKMAFKISRVLSLHSIVGLLATLSICEVTISILLATPAATAFRVKLLRFFFEEIFDPMILFLTGVATTIYIYHIWKCKSAGLLDNQRIVLDTKEEENYKEIDVVCTRTTEICKVPYDF
jgi:hypothetical protein